MDKDLTELDAVVTPVDADLIYTVTDVGTTPTDKKSTWTVIKAFLKTYFDTLYPAANVAITGATKTKITYDAKGLVTFGEAATTADIAESTNKKYITDAEETAIGTIGDKLPLAGGTMTGKIVKAGTTEVGKTYTPATGYQTVTIDCAVNNIHIVSGHADGTAIAFAISNATSSQPFIISILQGAVVSTIAAWFATIRWAGGTAPTLTPTANKRDTFGFIRTGADTYDGFIIGQNC